ncbi:MAG: hypothetical protein SFT91_04505 [Rickettsiaceae bacterium]|nr:hypothetical protein [Rickettsiaceae bacterium]
MRFQEMQLKHNMLFIMILVIALSSELILENLGIMGAYLPNFIMSIVLAYAFHKPVPLWIVASGVALGESFFSTTPALMTFLILISYIFISTILPKGSLRNRNFHIVIFILISMVVYSSKILWLYSIDQRPEVSLMTIKMLVTIILFPIFYIFVEKLIKLLKC